MLQRHRPGYERFMRRTRVARWLGLIVCIGSAAAGVGRAPAQSEAREDYICTSHSVKQLISVIKYAPQGCRVEYTKDGTTKTLWSSQTNSAYCAVMAARLVTTLVKANFSCKTED
jgi:hypothetical protein